MSWTKVSRMNTSIVLLAILAIVGVSSVFVAHPNRPQNRITGGQLAKPKQFPYQIGLLLEQPYGGTGLCGGSLIDKKWVLTAAHCLDGVERANVLFGATNLIQAQQEMRVGRRHFHVHPKWSIENVTNDIALIELPKSVQLNDYVQLVNLPKIGRKYSSYRGVNVVASGWGATSDYAPDPSLDLRFIEREVIPNSICSLLFGFMIEPSDLCISTTGGQSTCFGDSGGPLVVNDFDRTLIGITSFGGEGCEQGQPVVFTRVTSYLDWIAYTTMMPLLV